MICKVGGQRLIPHANLRTTLESKVETQCRVDISNSAALRPPRAQLQTFNTSARNTEKNKIYSCRHCRVRWLTGQNGNKSLRTSSKTGPDCIKKRTTSQQPGATVYRGSIYCVISHCYGTHEPDAGSCPEPVEFCPDTHTVAYI